MLCPICGTKLMECLNGWFCPNHGIVIDKEIKQEKEKDDNRN